MKFSISTENPVTAKTPCLVIGVFSNGDLEGVASQLDQASEGQLSELVKAGDFDLNLGKCGLWSRPRGIAATRVLVVGAGSRVKFTASKYHHTAQSAARYLRDTRFAKVLNYLTELPLAGHDNTWMIRQAALASDSGNYRYTATRKQSEHDTRKIKEMSFADADGTSEALDQARAIAAGVRRARQLGNLPPNICNPLFLAEQAREIAANSDRAECEVLSQEKMEELGMGSLLSVARGSRNPPQLIVLSYNGAASDDAPYALVGKGITFDTGGISLKPGKSMDEMKYDMCGAAGVIGAFEACTLLKLPLNLVTVVPAVENMPDGDAYRPGDVVTSMSGQTIEVLNTDAEGRMILCDALTYVQKFKPRSIIDVATLTGACVVALGKHATGLMSRDDDFANELLAAGNEVHDRAWRLPIWDDYQNLLDTPYADMANIGGPTAGAVTAGCFLSRFTRNQRWAHLDVAGTAWDGGTKNGASGRPVGLLVKYLIDRCN
jgi:leucyl aminopeptidase